VFSRFKAPDIPDSIPVFAVRDLYIETVILVKYLEDIILPELTNKNAFLV
jgi:hypothetical protein